MNLNDFFVPIPGFDGRYVINAYGIVKRVAHERLYKTGRTIKYPEIVITCYKDGRSGYPVVKLTKPKGNCGSQYIHRLVALTFIPKPAHKNFVNHKNGNKMDCRLENLEWVTSAENHHHAVVKSLIVLPPKNKVPVKNTCTGEVYPSMIEAAKALEVPYDAVKRKLRGLRSDVPCLEVLKN